MPNLWDEYAGADGYDLVYDEVGAERMTRAPLKRLPGPFRRRPEPRPNPRAMARARAEASPESAPQIYLGVAPSTDTAAAGSQTITVQPTVPMYITDFFVDESIASDFLITSIKAGRIELFASADGVPASIFAVKGEQRAPIELKEIQANTIISITVTNRASAPRRFSAAFQGVDLSQSCT